MRYDPSTAEQPHTVASTRTARRRNSIFGVLLVTAVALLGAGCDGGTGTPDGTTASEQTATSDQATTAPDTPASPAEVKAAADVIAENVARHANEAARAAGRTVTVDDIVTAAHAEGPVLLITTPHGEGAKDTTGDLPAAGPDNEVGLDIQGQQRWVCAQGGTATAQDRPCN